MIYGTCSIAILNYQRVNLVRSQKIVKVRYGCAIILREEKSIPGRIELMAFFVKIISSPRLQHFQSTGSLGTQVLPGPRAEKTGTGIIQLNG
jgi:hypothetical protein